MKKTMFITSVIMVVVMAIALTTSSLAWFTAAGASQVTTNTLTMEAVANTSAGLLLSQDTTSFSKTSKTPSWGGSPATGLAEAKPVAPYSSAETNAVLDALAQNQFTGKSVDSSSGTNLWSNEAGYNDHYAGYVYVANAGDNDIKLTATIAFTDVAASSATMFVAVLAATAQDTDSTVGTTSAWEIVRIASKSGANDPVNSLTKLDISEDAFATGDPVSSALAESNVNPRTGNISSTVVSKRDGGNVAYSHYQKFLILAWYSADLTNYNSGALTQGKFSVTFSIGETVTE